METNFSFDWDRDKVGFDKTILNIDNIKLDYIKVRQRNEDTGILIPAWVFYGVQHDRYKSQSDTEWQLDKNNQRITDTPAGFAFLIINAIGGSIIDPVAGY